MVTFICFFSICLKFKIEFWTRVKEKLIDFDERFSFFFLFFYIFIDEMIIHHHHDHDHHHHHQSNQCVACLCFYILGVFQVRVLCPRQRSKSLNFIVQMIGLFMMMMMIYICVCVRGFFVSIDFNTYIMMNFKLKNFSLFSPDLV